MKEKAKNQHLYIMMTLYGELTGERTDIELAKKNRRLWNAWVCQGLKQEEKERMATHADISVEELDLTAEKEQEITSLFQRQVADRCPERITSLEIPKHEAAGGFIQTEFDQKVDFSRFIFPLATSFHDTVFKGGASFNGTVFRKRVNFNRADFLSNVTFTGARFEGGADFDPCYFKGSARFDRSEFVGDTIFACSHFHVESLFTGAIFHGSADFSDSAIFIPTRFGPVDFSEANFKGRATFRNAIFNENVTFGDVVFEREVGFSNTSFSGVADFRNSRFLGLADFRGVSKTIEGESHGGAFGHTTLFSGAYFADRADFYRRRFGPRDGHTNELTFANAIFERPVSFEEAEFPHYLPVLTNTSLPPSTKVTADNDHWPVMKPGPLRRLDTCWRLRPKVVPTTQAPSVMKASAASLRHAMSRQMLPEEEHFFFRREMWAAARAEPFWRNGHIYLYEVLSNFGYSIMRPLGWIALFWAIGTWVYAAQTEMGWGTGAAYSFATMFKFFGFQRTFLQTETAWLNPIPWMEVFAGGQTVAGFILLFFLGLGLRTRFRLR